MKQFLLYYLLFLSMNAFSQIKTSIIEIIGNKNDFNQKEVIITGFMTTEYEGMSIYLNTNDYLTKNTKNAIYVYLPSNHSKNLRSIFKNGYVEICGNYTSQLNGHFNDYNGGLVDIKFVRIISIENIENLNFELIDTIRFDENE